MIIIFHILLIESLNINIKNILSNNINKRDNILFLWPRHNKILFNRTIDSGNLIASIMVYREGILSPN